MVGFCLRCRIFDAGVSIGIALLVEHRDVRLLKNIQGLNSKAWPLSTLAYSTYSILQISGQKGDEPPPRDLNRGQCAGWTR